MFLDVPFVLYGALDTDHSFALVDGPDAETMRRLAISKDDWDRFELPLTFQASGYVWSIVGVLGIREHPWLPDTWWVWAIVTDPEVADMEIYAIWSPDSSLHGYLARHTDLIDTKDW